MNKITSFVQFGSLYGCFFRTNTTSPEERQFIHQQIKSPLQGSAADIYQGLQQLVDAGARIPEQLIRSAQQTYTRLQSSIAAMNYGRQVANKAAAWSSQSRELISLRNELQLAKQTPEQLMTHYADLCRKQLELTGQSDDTCLAAHSCDEMSIQVQHFLTQSLTARRELHGLLA